MVNRIKETLVKIIKSRLFVLIFVFCILFSILVGRVFYLQIVKGQYYLDNYQLTIRKVRETPGTRGNIYDRNGKLLAYNELAYSVIIEDNISGNNRNEILNGILAEIIEIVESNGDSVIEDFGIVLDSAGNFQFSQTNETLRLRFVADVYGQSYVEDLTAEQYASTPDDIIEYLCTNKTYGYGLDKDIEDREYLLKMVTLRYAINLNSYQKYIPTTLANDVSEETVATIMENLDRLDGVDITEESMRRYADSKYFASIIGYTGKISQEEYDALDEEQQEVYSKTDIVGKSGIEQTMDEILQGTKGETQYNVDSLGKVTEVVSTKEAGAGNDVYLTIDKELHALTYQLLEEKLAGILLSKLRNIMNYDPSTEEDASDIIIPIDDAYYAFIANEILDDGHFDDADAGPVEREVYQIFEARKESALNEILNEMNNSQALAYKNLSSEMKAYIDYVVDDVLKTQTGILMSDAIDTSDTVYKQWVKEETINLYQYLNYAISKSWIDTSKLTDYVSEEKYSDASEIYQGILSYLRNFLVSDINFDKLLYKYLIKSTGISGAQICAMVYEQGVLPMEEDVYQNLVAGTQDAYQWLYYKIQNLEITPGQLGLEPCTASAVVTDPDTGEVLVCVSYPGYDNNRLANTMDSKYYSQLVTGLSRPFYNNATQERTAPGSTYKMLSAIAGLTEGVITGTTCLDCIGVFDKVTPSPRCWVYPSNHYSLSVIGALEVSCNNFFYEVGYRLGLDQDEDYQSEIGIATLTKYAEMFGLNQTSGLEIAESEPEISDEYAVQSAIGQGTNNYTVSQLNRYVAAIANKGTVYNLSLLSKTTDVNGKIIKNYEPSVLNQITEVSDETWNLIHAGMVSMIENHTSFSNLGITMAGKTGTAQQSDIHPDHGLFVGFAPAEEPEIAIAVRIANGYSSTYAAEIGRDIAKAYFNVAPKEELIQGKAAELGTVVVGD